MNASLVPLMLRTAARRIVSNCAPASTPEIETLGRRDGSTADAEAVAPEAEGAPDATFSYEELAHGYQATVPDFPRTTTQEGPLRR